MRIKAAIAAALACASLSACAAKPSEEQLRPDEKTYDFIFVCPFLDNEYWTECVAGIAAADAELGTKTRVVASPDSAGFAEKMEENLEAAIHANPDGIMAYAGVEGMYPMIDLAAEKGITFVAVDSDAPKTRRTAFVGIDCYSTGYSAGERMVELMGGKGKIGVLISSLRAEKETMILEAFKNAVSDYDIEIISVCETEADASAAAAETKKMLAAEPSLCAIFSTCGYSSAGAARTLKAENRKDIFVLGFDDMTENLELLREGYIDGLYVQDPREMGYQSVYILKSCIDSGRPAKELHAINTIYVTKENVDNYK